MTNLKQEILKDFDLDNLIDSLCIGVGYTILPKNGKHYKNFKNKIKDFLSQAIDRVERETKLETLDWFNRSVIGYDDNKQRFIVKVEKIKTEGIESLSPNK